MSCSSSLFFFTPEKVQDFQHIDYYRSADYLKEVVKCLNGC